MVAIESFADVAVLRPSLQIAQQEMDEMHINWLFVVVVLFSTSCTDQREQNPVEDTAQFERVSANLVAHGERVADVLGCTGCHGSNLTGEDWSEPGFVNLWTANPTRSVARYTDAELAKIIRSGARADRELWEMPSQIFAQLSKEDMSAVIAFLRSKTAEGPVHDEPVFEEAARLELASGAYTSSRAEVAKKGAIWPPDAGKAHALGRYIVRATCAECHGLNLRGGQPYPEATMRPDLRIVAAYDIDQFRHLLRDGKAIGERDVSLMSEVALGRYKHFSDAEIAAVHGYLRRVAQLEP